MTLRDELIKRRPRSLSDLQAAAYVRMSTDDQRCSIPYQLDAIRGYAAMRKIELVRIYEDPGRSGLDLQGRPGLQRLLTDVLGGNCGFSRIIVYDVSRWGRFQDVDEAGYYEHLCWRCGVRVVYCAEQFADDNSPMSAVLKAIKRVMAGEFSREQSMRISASYRIAANLGHNLGGGTIFGLRRVLIDSHGKRVGRLRPGQRKATTDCHVSLEPGPAEEIRVVRDVFRMFVEDRLSASEIARILNRRGVKPQTGDRWYHASVTYMLSNEKYIGTQVYNRTSGRLKTDRRRNPPAEWVRVPGAFKGIVDPTLFWRAQQIRKARAEAKSHNQLLDELRTCHAAHGPVAGRHFRDFGLCGAKSYSDRFGSVQKAYALIGVTELPGHMMCDDQRARRAHRKGLAKEIKTLIEADGGVVLVDGAARVLGINGRLRVQVDLLKAYPTMSGALRWRIRLHDRRKTDVYLVVRFDTENTLLDFYVLPKDIVKADSFMLYLSNGAQFDQFRCANVEAVAAKLYRWPVRLGDLVSSAAGTMETPTD